MEPLNFCTRSRNTSDRHWALSQHVPTPHEKLKTFTGTGCNYPDQATRMTRRLLAQERCRSVDKPRVMVRRSFRDWRARRPRALRKYFGPREIATKPLTWFIRRRQEILLVVFYPWYCFYGDWLKRMPPSPHYVCLRFKFEQKSDCFRFTGGPEGLNLPQTTVSIVILATFL